MLNPNEAKAICAQNENPFVENKPYNPDVILSHVITHLMDGFAPAPGDKEKADLAKQLYIAAIQTLHESDMPVIEQSIVKMRDAIIEKVLPSEVATSKEDTQAIEEAPCYAADLKESVRFNVAGKSMTVKKQWIQWAVIAILILLLIKLFR
jgi:uncharacterized Fe-S center protein